MENYKDVAKQIRELNWKSLNEKDLQKLMVLSTYAALEFADSLRLTLRTHPRDMQIKKMSKEELDTDNLHFEDYNGPGDHYNFLAHFITKHNLLTKRLKEVGLSYSDEIYRLPSEVKVMSIASREKELPGIFTQILKAPKWNAPGLPAYRYYLERHLELDGGENGHASMLKDITIDDRVEDFYKIRLDMYRIIPKLFS